MKLDATEIRYLSDDVFRCLTATEMGSKNHEVVPSSLIAQISGLRTGGVNKCLSELAKRNLIARVQNTKYDGYRLTYGGYDFLAMRTFARRDTVYSVGNQIGTGKESDIYVVADADGFQNCMKIHRLGRISFRTIKSKRDYLGKAKSASWMYMSRLAATKEYAFMKVLYDNGFPVPKPVDQVRHCLVMELIDAFPLRQISEVGNPGALYSSLMDLIVRLARAGLIHGDFNEFNILLREKDPDSDQPDPQPILIDFPQMVSTDHANAEYYFNRDVDCIRTFFRRRFRYESAIFPRFSTVVRDGQRDFDLDVQIAASGWDKNRDTELRQYIETIAEDDAAEEDEEESGSEIDEPAEEEEGVSESDDEDQVPQLIRDARGAELGKGKTVEDLARLDLDGRESEPEAMQEKASESDEEDSEDESLGSQDEDEDESEGEEGQGKKFVDKAKAKSQKGPIRMSTRAGKKPKFQERNVEAIVSSNIGRSAKRQERKHHSRSAANSQTLGRSKGSKAKADKNRTIADGQTF